MAFLPKSSPAPVCCWLILFVGLAFTGSRAGLVAGLLAALGQGLLLAAALRNWRVAPAGLLAGILALAAVASKPTTHVLLALPLDFTDPVASSLNRSHHLIWSDGRVALLAPN